MPVLLANNKIICIYYSSSFFINCPWKLMAIINPMVMIHGLKMKRITPLLLFLLFFFSLFSSPSPSLFTKYALHMYVPKAILFHHQSAGRWILIVPNGYQQLLFWGDRNGTFPTQSSQILLLVRDQKKTQTAAQVDQIRCNFYTGHKRPCLRGK